MNRFHRIIARRRYRDWLARLTHEADNDPQQRFARVRAVTPRPFCGMFCRDQGPLGDWHVCAEPADHGGAHHHCACGRRWPLDPVAEGQRWS